MAKRSSGGTDGDLGDGHRGWVVRAGGDWLWPRQNRGACTGLCNVPWRKSRRACDRVGWPTVGRGSGRVIGMGRCPLRFGRRCVPWEESSRSCGSIATMPLISGLVSAQCVLHCEDMREGTESGRVVGSRWRDDAAATALRRGGPVGGHALRGCGWAGVLASSASTLRTPGVLARVR